MCNIGVLAPAYQRAAYLAGCDVPMTPELEQTMEELQTIATALEAEKQMTPHNTRRIDGYTEVVAGGDSNDDVAEGTGSADDTEANTEGVTSDDSARQGSRTPNSPSVKTPQRTAMPTSTLSPSSKAIFSDLRTERVAELAILTDTRQKARLYTEYGMKNAQLYGLLLDAVTEEIADNVFMDKDRTNQDGVRCWNQLNQFVEEENIDIVLDKLAQRCEVRGSTSPETFEVKYQQLLTNAAAYQRSGGQLSAGEIVRRAIKLLPQEWASLRPDWAALARSIDKHTVRVPPEVAIRMKHDVVAMMGTKSDLSFTNKHVNKEKHIRVAALKATNKNGGGQGRPGPKEYMNSKTCHFCGDTGHFVKECPEVQRLRALDTKTEGSTKKKMMAIRTALCGLSHRKAQNVAKHGWMIDSWAPWTMSPHKHDFLTLVPLKEKMVCIVVNEDRRVQTESLADLEHGKVDIG